jgi:hypothetical protein
MPATVCALSAPTGDSSPVVTGLTSPTCAPSVSFAEELTVLPLNAVLQKALRTVDAGPVVRPPPEPPPVDLHGILECLPPEDHTAFAAHFIEEDIAACSNGLPVQQSPVTAGVGHAFRLVVPQLRPNKHPLPNGPGLVEYAIPMEKA